MMTAMLTQLPLPWLPEGAVEIAPGVGLVIGPDGGVVWVHGLATFAWDAGDEAGRRLAAVGLCSPRLKAASQEQVAAAFGVIPVTVWRWARALERAGVAGLVPEVKGPRRASKLTAAVVARIAALDRQGVSRARIAAACGVSESSVRNALRPAGSGAGAAGRAGGGEDAGPAAGGEEPAAGGLPVLPGPVARDAGRVLARWGLLGEGAGPVFAPGARYPLAGLLLALPALEGAGLLDCARATYGRLRSGFYGLTATLLTLVFLALLREPRAEGATRVPPAALGRVPVLDRAPEVKTIRRKLAGLAAAGKAADLIMALARHHAASRPGALGFLYADGHVRALLRHAGRAEDARGEAEVPRRGHAGDLGHRSAWRPGVHGHRRALRLAGRGAARPAPAAAPGRGRSARHGVLRPRRLVTGPVRRRPGGRVRPAHLPQGTGSRPARRRVCHGRLRR